MTQPPTSKSFLFIFRQGPHHRLSTKEGLDFSLAATAFGQTVSILFVDDGVFQLLNNQNCTALDMKNHSKALEALPLYGIDSIYRSKDDINNRGLSSEDLINLGDEVDAAQITHLIAQHDFVFNY